MVQDLTVNKVLICRPSPEDVTFNVVCEQSQPMGKTMAIQLHSLNFLSVFENLYHGFMVF